MTYRAVLFDLDGTLLDTLQDIADSTNKALAQMGFPPHPTEAYKQFVGEGRDVLALRSLPEPNRGPATAARLASLIDDDYTGRWQAYTRPYEGIPELLDALTARGVKMAVLSNKSHTFVELMVGKLLSRWRFDAVQGAMEGLPRKPDPAGAIRVARELKINPPEFLYIGDSGIDMKTANAAGMFAVGALWGFRDRKSVV